ncbi:ATP-binding protein [Wukongibacter baidiensis]|uniref:ATP-binding protein n=1 Tax=Wukongibacter baidiensis TaxID=1723361 RepID=UPI003D7FD19F
MQNTTIPYNKLILYHQILEDPIVKNVQYLLDIYYDDINRSKGSFKDCYYRTYYKLLEKAQQERVCGYLWKNYLLMLLLDDENVFSLACEKESFEISKTLYTTAVHDMDILKALYEINWKEIENTIGIETISFCDFFEINEKEDYFSIQYTKKVKNLYKAFSEPLSCEELVEYFIRHYHVVGTGKFGKYAAFRWDNGLKEIENPDPIKFEDLIGYHYQKEILIKNTEAFVNGKKANNVLLFGDRGTGKSSSVKALLNTYAHHGLRMIELSKNQLVHFYDIVKAIKNRGLRFIIFMDDLSFEDFETDSKYMKAMIEGGLEIKPDNVLIYVTSNRRHLIKESLADDLHEKDSREERLSLSDRFGITITYLSPNQEEYFKIIEEVALKKGINMPTDILKEKAFHWGMRYNGRSGRTAHQFIDYLVGEACNN